MLGILTRSRSLRSGGSGGSGIGGGAAAGAGGGGHAGEAEARPHGPTPPAAAEPGLVSGPTLQNSTVLGLVENGPVPSKFPDGKNPYLNRPLPPPPPPRDNTAATMPARPGMLSEGQTGQEAPPRPNFNKRMSRDDMFLTQPSRRPDFGKRMSRDDMFLDTKMARVARRGFPMPVMPPPAPVPVRGQLPTPEPSPKVNNVPTFASVVVPPARIATPESRASGEIPIGMTVLTPAHSPADTAPTAWPPKAAAMLGSQPLGSLEVLPTSQPSMQRTKTGRRKLFGLFGSKKHQEPGPVRKYHPPLEGTTYKDLEEANAAWMAAVTPTRSPVRSPARSNTVADRGASRHQPLRTNTTPATPPPVKEHSRGLLPFLRSKQSEPSMKFRQNEGSFNIPVPTMTYLDVEIPDIKMERYSVMFGGLLGPQQQSSSLLARRQATLDKLKTVNDQVTEEDMKTKTTLQRRATSPQPTRSPTFSLFPTTPATRKVESPTAVAPMPSPRFRSNTSPAMLSSPVKPTFEREPVRAERRQAERRQGNQAYVNPLQSNPAMMRAAAPSKPPREAPAPRPPVQFEPTQSTLLLDSPTSFEDGDDSSSKLSQPSLKPNIPEPQWQMVSPSASSAPSEGPSSSASSTRKRSPSSISSVMTHVTKPSIDEPDTHLKSAVEISIARQISISRQQRQMLRPLKTKLPEAKKQPSPSPSSATTQQTSTPTQAQKSSNKATNPAQPSGSKMRASAMPAPLRAVPNPAQRKLARVEKLQETKMATPTLVRAERSMGQHNRRSERAIVEAI